MNPTQFDLGEKIYQGVYYTFYQDLSDHQRWIKTLNPYRTKQYPFGMTIRYPMPFYTLVKFGVPDLITHEFRILQALPEEFKPYLLENVSLEKTRQGQSVMISRQAMDYDGRPAKSMKSIGKIQNQHFWREFSTLISILERTKTYLFGIFSGGTEILVHKLSEDTWKPRLIDVSRNGRTTYPFHPELWLEGYRKKKFHRRIERFLTRYQRM